MKIFTQQQALKFIGTKICGRANASSGMGYRKPIPPEDEAREVLAFVVFSHVPVEHFISDQSVWCISGMLSGEYCWSTWERCRSTTRISTATCVSNLLVIYSPCCLKISSKIFNKDLKRRANLVLSKPNRAQAFDTIECIRPMVVAAPFGRYSFVPGNRCSM